MNWVRFYHVWWAVVELLFVWLLRFEEREVIKQTDGEQVLLPEPQNACGRRTCGWIMARIQEVFTTGFLLGSALAYFFDGYSIMGWAGAEDARMPGYCWLIGMSVGFCNVMLQWMVPGKSAGRIRDTLMGMGMAFLLISVALGWKDQGITLLDARTIISIVVFTVTICLAFLAIRIARYVPLDPGASTAVPLSFLYAIYSTDQFPSPDSSRFLVVACIALALTPVRAFLLRRVLKPEELCGCAPKSNKQRREIKQKKAKTKDKQDGFFANFDKGFRKSWEKNRAHAQNGGEHVYMPLSNIETPFHTEEGVEEFQFRKWQTIPLRPQTTLGRGEALDQSSS